MPPKKRCDEAAGVEARQPVLGDDRQRQLLGEGGLVAGFLPGVERPVELAQRVGVAGIVGREERILELAQARAPLDDGRGLGEPPPALVEALEQRGQRPQRRRFQAADLAVGLDVLPRGAVLPGRVAQQHPPQAEQPRVLRRCRALRQLQRLAVLAVQAPADAGASRIQRCSSGRSSSPMPKRCAQRRHLQQVEHVARRDARLGQVEQQLERVHQRVELALRAVGQPERDEARVGGIRQAEHRLDVRGVGLDVGHHHDHVARAQRRIGAEGGEQLVVQDLDFALRAVRDVEAQRAIGRRVDRAMLRADLRQRAQLAGCPPGSAAAGSAPPVSSNRSIVCPIRCSERAQASRRAASSCRSSAAM